ncbi:motile sperm domain-containing protein 2-like [Tribolium madens]|uniref:motile sperm domain-containing protein 2-like n=1 Tax=Tribolium madens TaxID=41895 RepID=UPI001CF7644B|nr:motile sperm domain-containing protein 2-like [Tribolium madens]XP_044270380.1 motile sperm domain-containing protein 2-like [Tribolium madens]
MSSVQIQELRDAFLQQLASKGNDAVHPKDLERVKKDDNWVNRFLLQHDNNQTEALNMMWETLTWRKEFNVNEINDHVKMDIIVQGGFFPHGHDKDGCSLFVFKCKKYVKGTHNMDDLKRCVVYWFERLERQDKGKPITLFFDMEGCGLANMDLEFTKYLIGLFKQYYPYFLNYILIFEMPWILNAAFKIIKSWLPEKAVQKIKFVGKKDIKEYVPLDQALTCWGGQNDYTFSFLPEPQEEVPNNVSTASSRKVHFADGSSMSESPEGSGDREHDGSTLSVQPSNIITFVKEGGELVSTVELQNIDSSLILSFKLKTTSPEKFRVRPSVGCLTPGARATVHVTLLPGFQLGGLSRDKFLVMSTVIEPREMNEDLTQLWKDTSGRKLNQHRLKCAQSNDISKNGNAVPVPGGSSDGDYTNTSQLMTKINNLTECQSQLHGAVKRIQYFQMVIVLLVIVLGVMLSYVLHLESREGYSGSCSAP